MNWFLSFWLSSTRSSDPSPAPVLILAAHTMVQSGEQLCHHLQCIYLNLSRLQNRASALVRVGFFMRIHLHFKPQNVSLPDALLHKTKISIRLGTKPRIAAAQVLTSFPGGLIRTGSLDACPFLVCRTASSIPSQASNIHAFWLLVRFASESLFQA